MTRQTIRIGALGASRITPLALVAPAAQVAEVKVAAVAARDPSRAQEFAQHHDIPSVHRSYDDLICDAAIDAVYIALPHGLHGRWTSAALRAGKHVLCEKPFAANADEAADVAALAVRCGRLAVEGFHWRYHPLAARLLEIVRSGQIGSVEHLQARVTFRADELRTDPELASGALMDAGCYAVSLVRAVVGSEPTVADASAQQIAPGVDLSMDAQLEWPGGITARVLTGPSDTPANELAITGSRGQVRVRGFIAPQFGHEVRIVTATVDRVEDLGTSASFVHQLRAFAQAIGRGTRLPTDAQDAVANMRVIDAIYVTAGMQPRKPAP